MSRVAHLFGLELASGELTRITDFAPAEKPGLLQTFLDPTRPVAYLRNGRVFVAMDLASGETRPVYEVPEGYNGHSLGCTADGNTLVFNEMEDVSDRVRRGPGGQGFEAMFEARPHCRILAVGTDGSSPRVVHEDERWLAHVNASPALPDVLTFCHEGPWHRVQRLWALRISTGETWALRKQTPPDAIGHEYWFADGERIGYHGWSDPSQHLFGWVTWDGSDGREWAFRGRSMHFHSIDETLVVGDGHKDVPYLLVWRQAGQAYEGPRILATHRSSFHVQYLHVHPRMFRSPDGTVRVIYTSDDSGYGNVCIVDLPDFDDLPPGDL
jgi:oligogalacturonide lyase